MYSKNTIDISTKETCTLLMQYSNFQFTTIQNIFRLFKNATLNIFPIQLMLTS